MEYPEPGDQCPQCLPGKLEAEEGSCHCHVVPSPPCGYCESRRLECGNCGYIWEED